MQVTESCRPTPELANQFEDARERSEPVKAIVLGGCGILGLSLLTYLKEQQDISDILVTDIEEDRLKELVTWLNDKRFSFNVLDAGNYDALVRAMAGYDLVLNTSAVRNKLPATKAALAVGANYIDSGAGPADEQIALGEEFKKRGLLGIVHMYFSPGLDNVLAHYAIEKLDRTESVDFRWAVLDIVPSTEHSTPLYWAFSFDGIMLRHFGYPSKRLKDGKVLELPPRAEPEAYTFKGPIGTTEVAGLPAESLHWAHKYYPEIPNITFKEALGTDFDKKCLFLAHLGLNRTEPVNIQGQLVSPWEVLKHLANNQPPETKKGPDIRHGGGAIVTGFKDGLKIQFDIQQWPSEDLVRKHKEMGCARFGGPGGTFRNGSPLGSIAVLIAKGKIKAKGVFGPGVVEPTEEFMKQEVAMGQNIEITRTIVMQK
jgi:saccharopine dehydrogenase-like NADP-dependent oxidoreductase